MDFSTLKNKIEGELYTRDLYKKLYATDASIYRILPKAVVFPKHEADILVVVEFAKSHNIGITARTAGTSLAGQSVGDGIILDVSKHMTSILEIDVVNKKVKVQPGVIRDELNAELERHGLFFGPNTSTSNRCMIGGMMGNNSSGTTSIQYGVTRDKILKSRVVLASGEIAEFEVETSDSFQKALKEDSHKAKIYSFLKDKLSNKNLRGLIYENYPDPSIHRRNTGYAIDLLANTELFEENATEVFNLNKLLSGSEGTLAISTEITLALDELPPKYMALVVSQYQDYTSCLSDVLHQMEHQLYTCEMLDKPILDRTKENALYARYRAFIEGDPQAILMSEVRAHTLEDLAKQTQALQADIQAKALAYDVKILYEEEANQALELRKAGLGLIGNMVGDKKAIGCIEDTAVSLAYLPEFIADFQQIMKDFKQEGVYYAHAGAGELHIRPIFNMKKSEDIQQFVEITKAVAKLAKRYKASFSGEHGDGIVRSTYLELIIGKQLYEELKALKAVFDPQNILNPGKIINASPMHENLRYEADRVEPEIKTKLSFEDSLGILRMAEKCNGSGDCRKTHHSGATMCPSYQATKDELHSTRGRANVLREVLTENNAQAFDSEELKEALSLCLSCKACQTECPSNVDIATAKTEFLYQYQKIHGSSLSQKLFAYNTKLLNKASLFPKLSNALFSNALSSKLIKSISKIAPERDLPKLKLAKFRDLKLPISQSTKVVLLIDEFVGLLDGKIAEDAYELLQRLGYEILLIPKFDSGRSFLSKGFLDQAKVLVDKNLSLLEKYLSENTCFVGIEPSAILSLRDEYLRLASDKNLAQKIADKSLMIEEFTLKEYLEDKLTSSLFTEEYKEIKIHNHCHQKALGSQKDTFDILNIPKNYKPTILPTGCCGMAGSFGYEKENYELSLKIADLLLTPAVKRSTEDVLIASNGISCRQQISHTTDRKALHPVQILLKALNT